MARKFRINPHTGRLDRVLDPDEEGLMDKDTYDADDDAIIDKAESIDDGAGNTASASDIKDSVDKKHEQNKDTLLDEGGANEVSASDAKDAVDKKHTQNTDTKLDEGGANEISAEDIIAGLSSVATEWTLQSPPESHPWSAVAYGNGRFVAVTYTGTNRVMTSEDGVVWKAYPAPAYAWSGVTYGNGQFVAISSTGSMTSSDGINWTYHAWSGISCDTRGIGYGNGLYIAVGENDDRIVTSPDGVNWTARTGGFNMMSATYGNGAYVAVGTSNNIQYSTDGINWAGVSPGGSNRWRSVCYGNGLFVAVSSYSSNRVATSPDGINWTLRTSSGEGNQWYAVTYGDGLFVALARYGTNKVMTSPDGINWTGISADTERWTGITYGNGVFVGVADDGTYRVMTSGEIKQHIKPHNNIYQGGMDIRGNVEIAGELKIEVYEQGTEPTLTADNFMAMWKDTSVSGSPDVYLIFRRGSGDQVKVLLS